MFQFKVAASEWQGASCGLISRERDSTRITLVKRSGVRVGEQKITPDTCYSHMELISLAYLPDVAGGVAKKYGGSQVKGSNADLWALLTFHLRLSLFVAPAFD